jgi:hypothetical protein
LPQLLELGLSWPRTTTRSLPSEQSWPRMPSRVLCLQYDIE